MSGSEVIDQQMLQIILLENKKWKRERDREESKKKKKEFEERFNTERAKQLIFSNLSRVSQLFQFSIIHILSYTYINKFYEFCSSNSILSTPLYYSVFSAQSPSFFSLSFPFLYLFISLYSLSLFYFLSCFSFSSISIFLLLTFSTLSSIKLLLFDFLNFQNQLIFLYSPHSYKIYFILFSMRQQVINYQSDVIQKEYHHTQTHFSVNDPYHHRYGTWRLQQTIQRFTTNCDYSIKWIGCDANAHALSFFYCMLVGCLQDGSEHDDLFIKLKYSLYQQSKQALSISEQKIFIQHLSLIQDSKNIGEFLKKSSHLEPIFIKVFSTRCSQMTKKQLKSSVSIKHSKMEELQWYSAIFPFSSFIVLNQKCSNLSINQQKFLIVEQKSCFFVIEETQNTLNSCRISSVPTKKKIKTEIYGHGLQYLESLKLDIVDSKQETTQDVEKNRKKTVSISKSQSKDVTSQQITDKKSKSNTNYQVFSIAQVPEEEITDSKINTLEEKKRLLSIQTANINMASSIITVNPNSSPTTQTFTKVTLKSDITQPQKIIKAQMQPSLRSSIKDQKNLMGFICPKITSQRGSLEKDMKFKANMKKQLNKMIYSIPTQPSAEQNGYGPDSDPRDPRQSFVYRTLSPKEGALFKKQLPGKYTINKVPKFLSKKQEQPISYTVTTSPFKDQHQSPHNKNNLMVDKKQRKTIKDVKQMTKDIKEVKEVKKMTLQQQASLPTIPVTITTKDGFYRNKNH